MTADTRRTSADALALMALGLGLLYHAGPWPWLSRTLTIVGATAPAWVLAGAAGMLPWPWLILTALVLLANLTMPTIEAFTVYAFGNVVSQLLLTALWVVWARQTRDQLAWLGAALAGIGAVVLAAIPQLVLKLYLGQGAPIPDPWTPWRTGEYGPVDMLSRVAPWLMGPEGTMVLLALGAWLWWGLRPRLHV